MLLPTACTQGPSSLVSEHCLFGNESIPTGTGVLELVQRDSTRPGLTPHCHEVRSEGSERQLFRLSGLRRPQMSPYPGPVRERAGQRSGHGALDPRDRVSPSLAIYHSRLDVLLPEGTTAHCNAYSLPLRFSIRAPSAHRASTSETENREPEIPITLAIIWPCAPKLASLLTGPCSL